MIESRALCPVLSTSWRKGLQPHRITARGRILPQDAVFPEGAEDLRDLALRQVQPFGQLADAEIRLVAQEFPEDPQSGAQRLHRIHPDL
jgi:hypothetical protein